MKIGGRKGILISSASTFLVCGLVFGAFSLFKHSFKADEVLNAPAAPTNLMAADNVDETAISLQWNDNSTDEIGFKIERSSDIVNSDFCEIGTVQKNQLKYTDSNITKGKRYWYKVRAYNQSGFSDYTLIATPTRIEAKDYLNEAGDFEKTSMLPGVAGAWWANTEDSHFEFRLDQGSGIDKSASQYIGFKGPWSESGKYLGFAYNPNILIDDSNENFVHHGDKVVVDIDQYVTHNIIGKTNTKFQTAVFFYRSDETEVSHQYYQLPGQADDTPYSFQTNELIVPDEANRVEIKFTLSSDYPLSDEEAFGANIDGVKMFVTRSGVQQTVQIPTTRNRNINTGGVAFDPNNEDFYEVATNTDMVSTHVMEYPSVVALRYYNPNIKLIGYTSADFSDGRSWDGGSPNKFKADPVVSISPVPFGWALDQQKKLAEGDSWFVKFQPGIEAQTEYKDKRIARGTQYQYDNDGVTPLPYVYADGYIDRYAANLDSQSYRDIWVKDVVAMYQKYKFDGMFLDDTGPYSIYGTKISDGTTAKAADITAAQVQGFLHDVIPRVNAQLPNFEWLQNADTQHYADVVPPGTCRWCGWFGRATLLPNWDPSLESAGKNGLPDDFVAANYSKNTFENTPETFFQEDSYIRGGYRDDLSLSTTDYNFHSWQMAVKDMDVLNEFNQTQFDEKKKKQIFQSLHIINNPNVNNFANTPNINKDSDLAVYNTGWSPFVLASYLLNSSEYSYLEALQDNVVGSGSSATLERAHPRDADLGFGLTQRLGDALGDRKIVYNGTDYDYGDPIFEDADYSNSEARKLLQYRIFQNGLAVVNSSPDQNQTFTLPADMIDEFGRTYSGSDKTIVLLPHTGRIFFRPGLISAKVSNGAAQRHGYYVETPKVALTAVNSPGNQVGDILYKLDDGIPQTYSGEITISDGFHIINYYSSSSDPDSGSYMWLMVKTVKPQNTTVNISRSFTYKPSISLTGSAIGDVAKIYTNGDDGDYVFDDTWYKQINLNIGSNSYNFKLEDYAGNESDITPFTIIRRKPADANADNAINMADFSKLMSNWGKTDSSNDADFDEDNKVGMSDFSIMMNNWGK